MSRPASGASAFAAAVSSLVVVGDFRATVSERMPASRRSPICFGIGTPER
jgi:hypothetical protein